MRTILRTALPLALILLLGPAALAEPGQRDRVDARIHDRLAELGRLRVLVFLDAPAPTPHDRSRRMADVSRAQDAVLNGLRADEFTLRRRFEVIPALAGDITAEGLHRLLALPGVLRVDEDTGGQIEMWQSLPLVNLDDVVTNGNTGQGVTVAILDTGIDTDHADLGGDLVAEACFCTGDGTGGPCCPSGSDTEFGPGAAEDDHGHGSNVAGIVTSSGIVAPEGGAPDAEIVAIKVVDNNGIFCCSSDVIAGLDWIIANRPDVDIVNMSLGTATLYSGECDALRPTPSTVRGFASAIDTLRDSGVLTFSSSGNAGSGTQMSAPACVGNAISVGAVYDASLGSINFFGCTDASTSADLVSCWSNSNSTTDLFAPGAAITSDYLFNGTSTFYGTSQASPHAASCAADILEADPTLTPDAIESAMKASGVAVTDAKNGLTFPRVDCLAAMVVLGLPEPRAELQLIAGAVFLAAAGRLRPKR